MIKTRVGYSQKSAACLNISQKLGSRVGVDKTTNKDALLVLSNLSTAVYSDKNRSGEFSKMEGMFECF